MRVENWGLKLLAVIEEHKKLPFDWAKTNCVFFAMDCAKAITGVDPFEQIRGTVVDEPTALEAMHDLGFDNLVDTCASVYAEVPVAQAQRGDIGFIEQGTLIPVVFVNDGAIGHMQAGLKFVGRKFIQKAFRVE